MSAEKKQKMADEATELTPSLSAHGSQDSEHIEISNTLEQISTPSTSNTDQVDDQQHDVSVETVPLNESETEPIDPQQSTSQEFVFLRPRSPPSRVVASGSTMSSDEDKIHLLKSKDSLNLAGYNHLVGLYRRLQHKLQKQQRFDAEFEKGAVTAINELARQATIIKQLKRRLVNRR